MKDIFIITAFFSKMFFKKKIIPTRGFLKTGKGLSERI